VLALARSRLATENDLCHVLGIGLAAGATLGERAAMDRSIVATAGDSGCLESESGNFLDGFIT
jgi:hypothetical protein